jgi:hypothetical protein
MDDGMFNFLTLRHADKVAVGTGTARNVVGVVCAGDDPSAPRRRPRQALAQVQPAVGTGSAVRIAYSSAVGTGSAISTGNFSFF